MNNCLFLILLLIGSGTCLFFLLNSLYRKTKHYSMQNTHVLHLLELDKSARFEFVNVGSSQLLFGLDYSQLDVEADNWAAYPQYFDCDYAILKQFSRLIKRGAIVFLPVCIMEFFAGGGEGNEINSYYSVIDRRNLPYCDLKLYYLNRYPILRRPQLIKYVFKDVDWSWNGYDVERNFCKNSIEYVKDANGFIERWNKGFNTSIPSLDLNIEQIANINRNTKVLGEMSEYCRRKGWHPIFLILPATKYLTDKFTKEFFEKNVIENLKAADECTPILNYWGNETFMGDDLYLNSFFMNKKGRLIMTSKVIEDATMIFNEHD